MIRQSAFAFLLSLAMAGAQGALAMDLPPPVYAPEISTGGVGQGWYMRGDLGYTGWSGISAPSYNVVGNGGAVAAVESFDDARFDRHFAYGGGLGYQVNDFLRTDATLDFFNDSFSGSSSIDAPCNNAQVAGTSCGFNHSGSLRGIGVLGNVYADLGTYDGLTPYVGAGAGVTEVKWNSASSTPFCVNGTGTCNGTTYAAQANEGLDNWRFTYALMAGVSYDITSSMKLDFGYRYSKIAGGDIYDYSAAEKALGASGAKASDSGLTRQEIRAGLRITTW